MGVSLSDNTIDNTVTACVRNAVVTAGGNISITSGSTGVIDALTVATSVAVSIGGAGAGGDADATITSKVEAYAGGNARFDAGQDIAITATSNYQPTADSYGVAGGLVAVGASLAKASANGSIKAHMDGSVSNARNLTVEAEADHDAKANAFALAGGLLATGAGAGFGSICQSHDSCLRW